MSDEKRELPNMTATEVANTRYRGPVPSDALLKHMLDMEVKHIEAARHVIGSSPGMDALGIKAGDD